MGSLIVIPLVGFLGILFIIFNIVILVLFILTVITGIVKFVRRTSKKAFFVLLVVTAVLMIIDFNIINSVVNYDEVQRQEQIREEGKELVAIKDYDYEQVEQYLDEGWDPNETTKAVYYSIKYNTEENIQNDEWDILELLLEHGAEPDVQIYEDPQGVNSPLTFSAECGYYGAVKLLLENGADPNYQESYMNENGLLALRFYENDEAAEILQLLLDYGTDLDIRETIGEEPSYSGREMLQNFENDYGDVKENVPDYDDIVEIINGMGL